MRRAVIFLAVLIIVGILGYYVIQWFRIPDPALLIFGILLLVGLFFGAYGLWSHRGDTLD
jgi:energy-coupling factor transporter transmembrane protein EcfT